MSTTPTAPRDADVLGALAAVIASRQGGDPNQSYVARLLHKGTDAILKKIGEEATELVMAAKDGEPDKIIYETADLWFHSLVLLRQFGLHPHDVLKELQRREGLSGLAEFAARSQPASAPIAAATSPTSSLDKDSQ